MLPEALEIRQTPAQSLAKNPEWGESLKNPEKLQTSETGLKAKEFVEIQIPPEVLKLRNLFNNSGYRIWVVGGSARDAILNLEPKDWDLITDAPPEAKNQLLKSTGWSFKSVPRQESNGITSMVSSDTNEEYEIATLRTDSGERRNNQVTYSTNLRNDLVRRDFTFNTLVIDLLNQVDGKYAVLDYTGGLEDLKKPCPIIQTLGDASEKLIGDRSRILRAVMFASRFNFQISKELDQAIKSDNQLTVINSKGEIEGVTKESKKEQLFKGIKTTLSLQNYFKLMNDYDLLSQVLPEIKLDFSQLENLENYPNISRDPIFVIVSLLGNSSYSDRDQLEKLSGLLKILKYNKLEVAKIIYLLKLTNLTPEIAVNLKKDQKISFETDLLKSFFSFTKVEPRTSNGFIAYLDSPKINAKSIIDNLPKPIDPKLISIAVQDAEILVFTELCDKN